VAKTYFENLVSPSLVNHFHISDAGLVLKLRSREPSLPIDITWIFVNHLFSLKDKRQTSALVGNVTDTFLHDLEGRSGWLGSEYPLRRANFLATYGVDVASAALRTLSDDEWIERAPEALFRDREAYISARRVAETNSRIGPQPHPHLGRPRGLGPGERSMVYSRSIEPSVTDLLYLAANAPLLGGSSNEQVEKRERWMRAELIFYLREIGAHARRADNPTVDVDLNRRLQRLGITLGADVDVDFEYVRDLCARVGLRGAADDITTLKGFADEPRKAPFFKDLAAFVFAVRDVLAGENIARLSETGPVLVPYGAPHAEGHFVHTVSALSRRGVGQLVDGHGRTIDMDRVKTMISAPSFVTPPILQRSREQAEADRRVNGGRGKTLTRLERELAAGEVLVIGTSGTDQRVVPLQAPGEDAAYSRHYNGGGNLHGTGEQLATALRSLDLAMLQAVAAGSYQPARLSWCAHRLPTRDRDFVMVNPYADEATVARMQLPGALGHIGVTRSPRPGLLTDDMMPTVASRRPLFIDYFLPIYPVDVEHLLPFVSPFPESLVHPPLEGGSACRNGGALLLDPKTGRTAIPTSPNFTTETERKGLGLLI
jgi:hypothetical protein